MLRSLYSGISGLRQHQTMMDVVGNNIANVNTAGFKASNVVFEDTMSQMLRAAGAPQGTEGGTNPAQVGLGVRLGSISTNFAQGSAQTTGKATDLMIQGDGFFAVQDAGETLYTRDGSFSFDENGDLITSGGAKVQGWMATNGVVNANAPLTSLSLPTGTVMPPVMTSTGGFKGNLPSDVAVGTTISQSEKQYDAQGNAHDVTYTLKKLTASGTTDSWSVAATIDGVAATTSATQLDFNNANGTMTAPAATGTPPTRSFSLTAPWGTVTMDVTGVSEYGGNNTFGLTSNNGASAGTLTGFTITPDGTLNGQFSNGMKQALGQIAIATFNNPVGLEKVGGSEYRTTANSGTPDIGTAGVGGRGTIANNMLEMSNVDLSSEFTNLIIAQRGFQANSKVITTSDDILQTLVDLKR